MEFDWDETKRLGNIEKHSIDFLRAMLIFEGRVFTRRSDRGGEERSIAVGEVDDRVIAVVYTDRRHEGAIRRRPISARGARTDEEESYREIAGE